MKKPTDKELLTDKHNFMRVEFGYATNIIVPYAAGVAILDAMKNAELYDRTDYSNPVIKPLTNTDDVLHTYIISKEDYLDMKLKHILGFKDDTNK